MSDMSWIRWLKISESLAAAGHRVDMAVNGSAAAEHLESFSVQKENFGFADLGRADWGSYDVIKTLFHEGFEVAEKWGALRHPFIISKLGSVVAGEDREGIFFFGKQRESLFNIQRKINERSRCITVLTDPARHLWEECFGPTSRLLVVPGGVDHEIPPPGKDPYPTGKIRCLYAGNIYNESSQPEAHHLLVQKLNCLGCELSRHDIQLCFLGVGDTRNIDRNSVCCLGEVDYNASWDYLYHADVGIALVPSTFLHNNESTKLYCYLRGGLPMVIESGFPNENIIHESKFGYIVPGGDLRKMAEKVREAASRSWDREHGAYYVCSRHTWRHRAQIYDRLLRQVLPAEESA